MMVDPMQKAFIELRFDGGGIMPSNMRAGDLATMLQAMEALITSSVLQGHSELTRDDIILGLSEIQSGSVGLRFTPSIPQIIMPEFERLIDSIRQQRFDLLTHDAREALRRIATFTRKNRCVAQLWSMSRQGIQATIDQELLIPSVPRLAIQTIIYGHVVNVGGKKSNAHLETIQGQTVICKGNESQIKQLAQQLYSMVGVSGQAYCDVDTLKIYDFTIDEILPYEDTPITEAFRDLAEIGASHFDRIDVDAYVREIRGDAWEE